MNYTVYILYTVSKNKFYIGYTSGPIEERLKKHNTNHNGFTGTTPDWTIKYTEKFATKIEALKREKQIKGWKSRKMLESLIENTGSKGLVHPDKQSGGSLVRTQ